MKKLFNLPNKWQKSKTKPLPSTEMNRESLLLPQKPEYPLQATYHRTCKTLPLQAFINASCNNDLSGLLIEGEAKQDELLEAWSEIVFDYSGLVRTENSEHLFSLKKQIAIMQHHIIYIDYAVQFLRIKYDQEIADEVRSFGYDVLEFENEGYQKALNRIESLAKTVVFEHGNLVDEYNRLTNTVEGKKQTEDEFIRTVVMLAKYQGYNIDRLTCTVYEFAQIFNNYLSEMKVREKQLTNG